MPTAADAAIAAIAYVALHAGHQIGDHVVQTKAAAAAKGAPTAEGLAAGVHPWAGWTACAAHVSTYVLVQALALGAVRLVAPLDVHGVVAALAVSASTHAVIDRRWLVRALIRAKRCEDWPDGPYLLDQSLHHGALLIAALTATVTSTNASVVTILVALVLVAVALAVEHRRSAAVPRVLEQ